MKSLNRLFALLIVCATAALAQQNGAAPAGSPAKPAASQASTLVANPAIWRIKGAHGTVYLFGSIHVMKPNVSWQSAPVKSAFSASDTVYVEVANMDDEAVAQPLAMKYGLDLAHPLSTKISKDDLALLDTAAKSIGLPGESMFEPMQPWLVSMTLSVLPMIKDGYAPTSGIDLTLLTQARQAGKSVKGFETMEQQIHLLADLPVEEQIKMLHKDLTEMDKSTAEMNEMVAAWERGDVEKIGRIENEDLAAKLPEEYKHMVLERNQSWTTTLDTMLKDPATGTVFVAVGAAHLAGPDSVLKMLEKNGWKIERE